MLHVILHRAKRAAQIVQREALGAKSVTSLGLRVENAKTAKIYRGNLSKLVHSDQEARLAVVIHLFYIENWPLFREKLQNILHLSYDLFITLPQQNEDFMEKLRHDFPTAQYIVVPNRGRDVLPFVMTATRLYELRYDYVLKVHSKKSTHWDGGQSWLETTLDQLLPRDNKCIEAIVTALARPGTGVIGPAEYYYPLTVNFDANGTHMTRILSRLFNKDVAWSCLQKNRQEYGFFGGTMFWARLDAIEPILSVAKVGHFEQEAGQIDGTCAHAFERLFCIVPELNGKTMYELNTKAMQKREYKSGNIPEWSELSKSKKK